MSTSNFCCLSYWYFQTGSHSLSARQRPTHIHWQVHSCEARVSFGNFIPAFSTPSHLSSFCLSISYTVFASRSPTQSNNPRKVSFMRDTVCLSSDGTFRENGHWFISGASSALIAGQGYIVTVLQRGISLLVIPNEQQVQAFHTTFALGTSVIK